MKNNKGFISISIIYSFFVIFMLLLVLIMSTYVNNRVQSNVYKNDIKMKMTSKKLSQFSAFLIKSNQLTKVNNDYLYVGKNVNNYISFNDEEWRIIGVFSKDSHGVGNDYLIKIMRSRPLPSTMIFDYKSANDSNNIGLSTQSTGGNNWSDSQLYMFLNPESYLNQGQTDNKILTNYLVDDNKYVYELRNKIDSNNNYIVDFKTIVFKNMGSYIQSDDEVFLPSKADIDNSFKSVLKTEYTQRLQTNYLSYIQETTWKLGAISVEPDKINVENEMKKFYNHEISKDVSDKDFYPQTSKGIIGLIYPSDYYRTKKGSEGTWMEITNAWTMSHLKKEKSKVIYINNNRFEQANANLSKNVYPVVYLKLNIKMESGSGTKADPYKVTR